MDGNGATSVFAAKQRSDATVFAAGARVKYPAASGAIETAQAMPAESFRLERFLQS